MRVLVTGARGFIGGTLVRQLLARGDAVTAVARHQSGANDLAATGCKLVELDLAVADVDALANALRDMDAVFHVAGSYRIGIPARQRAARPRPYARTPPVPRPECSASPASA